MRLSQKKNKAKKIFYKQAVNALAKLNKQGIIAPDANLCFYIHRIKKHDHVQTGLVACASIEDFQEGLIKKHESTQLKKEQECGRYFEVLNADITPVFLFYKYSKELDQTIQESCQKKTFVSIYFRKPGRSYFLANTRY